MWNRRQVWAHRLQLEAMTHESSSFVTLTYSDDCVPRTREGLATLAPEDVQGWLKRLRARLHPQLVRFFLVGEYGDTTHRPHYHCVLFGFKPCERGRTRRDSLTGECLGLDCCPQCRLIYDTWSRGIIEVGEVNSDSCGYIAGYVNKKMTRYDDVRLNGRNPEFARMSNRGGLGIGFIPSLASVYDNYALLVSRSDVVGVVGSGEKRKPLGRYLVRKLREALGRDGNTPQEVISALQAEMLPVFARSTYDSSSSFKKAVVSAGDQKFLEFKARQQIYGRKKSL